MTDIKQIEAKYREFWIWGITSIDEFGLKSAVLQETPTQLSYHVIEYAALTEAQAKIEKLEKALDVAVEALEFYSVNGLAKVQWGQPIDIKLASEFYVNGEFARQAMKKIRGEE